MNLLVLRKGSVDCFRFPEVYVGLVPTAPPRFRTCAWEVTMERKLELSEKARKVTRFDFTITRFLIELDAMLRFIPGWDPLVHGFDVTLVAHEEENGLFVRAMIRPHNWPPDSFVQIRMDKYANYRWIIAAGAMRAPHISYFEIDLNFDFEVSDLDREAMYITIKPEPLLEKLIKDVEQNYVSSAYLYAQAQAAQNNDSTIH